MPELVPIPHVGAGPRTIYGAIIESLIKAGYESAVCVNLEEFPRLTDAAPVTSFFGRFFPGDKMRSSFSPDKKSRLIWRVPRTKDAK